MLTSDQLHEYQKRAINFQSTHSQSALWLDMGLGKTIITLSSIAHLINTGYLRAVMVVAPIRVCRLVWRQEALKWEHTKHLKFSMVVGTKDQRTRALLQLADIYLMNYENLRWLSEVLQTYYISRDREPPFDGIVWDEISKMKNSTTKRVEALVGNARSKKPGIINHFKWLTGLTGTPAAAGYMDLHGQYLVLDQGKRLGTSKTAFRNRFYYKNGPYKYKAHPETQGNIEALIGDITLQMGAEDYNPLPDLIVNDVVLCMAESVRQQYEDLEKRYFVMLDSGTSVEVFNAASMTNKCLQFSNGAVYPIPGCPLWQPVHDEKLNALEDIIEEANGQPVLCAYAFKSDAKRIMEHFKKIRPINLTECKSEKALQNAMQRWTTGDCRLMIGHPASMGHGIDGLQAAGHILVWYGVTWSLQLYDQFNARLRRQAQKAPVICHRLLMKNTMDMAQVDALNGHAKTQTELRQALKRYRAKKEALQNRA